ncbi:MAG: ABC transporter ATP-binding protein [Deltaproteobacteria bacterium GWA2_57_13]|nr:MAG: ABC transporter ATP-binding protein [Deltaproteobacteria bacterium GWA2_57_13]OGQ51208.1 MAG: ABC transporter ATP-binding protein [Deltaproteobacteria bacterium RIFCSPLOWO2_02_FULL_57_26]OGQ75757.1 MAG: ABC transporter ATP-binding protein [Deltaproteobacteria bacterium RIFCSPLOWO2_12_FULL_57_22]
MIRVVDLYKSFGNQQVLKGVNMEFVTGKITTIVGTSGCGKTVLLKHLNALLLPDRGHVLVDSVDITQLRQKELYEMRGRFGVLFQGAALLDSMTIFDNVAFPLREKTKTSETQIRHKVEERLEQVGLEGMGYKYPAELSGGMKKRAGLARALVMDPEIVLFDEPTTGLDPVLATSIHQLIVRTQQTFGFTGVVVSHTIPQVFEISDYVAILANGIIEELKPTKEFQSSPNPVVQQFIRGETEGPIQVL